MPLVVSAVLLRERNKDHEFFVVDVDRNRDVSDNPFRIPLMSEQEHEGIQNWDCSVGRELQTGRQYCRDDRATYIGEGDVPGLGGLPARRRV